MKKLNMLKIIADVCSVFAGSLNPIVQKCKSLFVKNPWLWFSFFLYVIAYIPYAILSKQIGTKAQVWQIMILTSLAACVVTIVEFFLIGIYRFLKSKKTADIFSFWKELKITSTNVGMAIASALISLTTNASYMYTGAALVTMLLLTRGSVLIIAPLSDKIQKRTITPSTWVGFCLAILAVMCSILGAGVPAGTGWLVILALYVSAYFVNMKHYGANQENFRFLCASQLISCTLMLAISLLSLSVSDLTDFSMLTSDIKIKAFFVGVLAQTTGIFGPMMLMSKTEQTYSVPINRSGGIFAGTIAQKYLGKQIDTTTYFGLAFFIAAVFALAIGRSTNAQEQTDAVAYDAIRDENSTLHS